MCIMLEYFTTETEVQYRINLEFADNPECTTIFAVPVLLGECYTVMIIYFGSSPEHNAQVELEPYGLVLDNATAESNANIWLE